MKFSTREDIEAPIDYAFGQVSDFGTYERQALRRGADVQRIDSGPVQVGSAWDVAFSFRGKDRRMKLTVAEFDEPNTIKLNAISPNIDAVVLIELVPLTPHRTRISMSIDLSAKSLSARLLLQSIKLAKSNLTNKFKKRVAEFAQDVEDRFRTGA